jgi:hypothetical protein
MTQLNDYIAKQERFAKWLRNAFVAAGLPERLAIGSICRHDSVLTKCDIKNAIAVAAACGESFAGDIFTSLVLGRSSVHIKVMQDVVRNNRKALDCILHHCPAAPVRAVLERLDFFEKLAEVAPQRVPSLRLNVTHFPDLGRIALVAASRDWGLLRLALLVAEPGQLVPRPKSFFTYSRTSREHRAW